MQNMFNLEDAQVTIYLRDSSHYTLNFKGYLEYSGPDIWAMTGTILASDALKNQWVEIFKYGAGCTFYVNRDEIVSVYMIEIERKIEWKKENCINWKEINGSV